MKDFVRVPLRTSFGRRLHYDRLSLEDKTNELLDFLSENAYMRSMDFAQRILKFEGEESIEKIVSARENIPREKRQRIINIYKAYRYILSNKEINKETLKQLYSILSNKVLKKSDIDSLGDYYRTSKEYFSNGPRVQDIFEVGMNPPAIEKYMNKLLDYINDNDSDDEIENFIKSQIIHLYLVYIHPYPDINGRTGRTTAMWHLIKTKCYPYLTFNKAISLSRQGYNPSIKSATRRGNITPFLSYMMTEVKNELEIESIIDNINENFNLSPELNKMLEYILSVSGNATLENITWVYNIHNIRKIESQIFKEYIIPLINMGIVLYNEDSQTVIINPDILTINPETHKILRISKK